MAKGTNAKIKELKGIKPEKISAEDLGKLQTAVSKINQTYIELGRLSASQHSSLHSLAGLQDEMMVLQNDVEKTYGTNDVNIQDGTINYEEDVKANS